LKKRKRSKENQYRDLCPWKDLDREGGMGGIDETKDNGRRGWTKCKTPWAAK
jgi:hypothetical protein